MKIALFITCLADAMFPEVGKATVRVLERLGQDVEFPAEQTCCGQMHVNTGYQKQALPLVERFAEVFAPYDAIVAPSGSCVGSVRHQHAMIAKRFGSAGLVEQVEAVAAKTYELSEFLVDVLGVTRCRRLLPAPGDLSPDLPFAANAAGRRQADHAASGRRSAGACRVAGG